MSKGVELDREALVPQICARLATGKESLTDICKDLGMTRTTFNSWRAKYPDVDAVAQEAKDDGYDALAYDCLDIADDNTRDWKIELRGRNEVVVVDTEVVMRSRLRVETRLKLLARWDPKRYGDRIHQTVTGLDDGPVQVEDASAKLLDLLNRRKPGEANSE